MLQDASCTVPTWDSDDCTQHIYLASPPLLLNNPAVPVSAIPDITSRGLVTSFTGMSEVEFASRRSCLC